MNRRSFLVRGLSVAAATSLGAGCIQRRTSDEQPQNGSTQAGSGYAPNPRDVAAPDADPASFERIEVRGTPVPLVPIDVAHPWYLRREARFVDARSESQYDKSHVAGAVLSPAPRGYAQNDPTADWSTSSTIVTYCTCPHHLSSSRAAALIDAGFENVYALDEGFGAWFDRGYPVASASNVRTTIGKRRAISGQVDPAYAGQLVQLHHAPTEQREPAEIARDGSFEVTFRFVEIEADDTLILETPAGTRRGTVAEMVEGSDR